MANPHQAFRLALLSSQSRRAAEIVVASRLEATPAAVWERAITADGINYEMRPYLRMSVPPGVEELDPEQIELGVPIGRSWVFLFGLLPFDYDDLCLVRLEPGRGFLERSKMLSQRLWEHERSLEPLDGGCRVEDRVSWEPRLGLPATPLRPAIHWFFRHRHRRLQRYFGGDFSPPR